MAESGTVETSGAGGGGVRRRRPVPIASASVLHCLPGYVHAAFASSLSLLRLSLFFAIELLVPLQLTVACRLELQGLLVSRYWVAVALVAGGLLQTWVARVLLLLALFLQGINLRYQRDQHGL